MHDDGFFDEPIAARYDESSDEMFGSAVVDPVDSRKRVSVWQKPTA